MIVETDSFPLSIVPFDDFLEAFNRGHFGTKMIVTFEMKNVGTRDAPFFSVSSKGTDAEGVILIAEAMKKIESSKR